MSKFKLQDFDLDSLTIDLNEYGGMIYLENKPNLSFLADHHTIMQFVLLYNFQKSIQNLTKTVGEKCLS